MKFRARFADCRTKTVLARTKKPGEIECKGCAPHRACALAVQINNCRFAYGSVEPGVHARPERCRLERRPGTEGENGRVAWGEAPSAVSRTGSRRERYTKNSGCGSPGARGEAEARSRMSLGS